MANAKKEDTLDDIEDGLEGFAEGKSEFDGLGLDETFGTDDEIAALKAERDEMRDQFMRALADAENTRKRGERDRREAEMYGGTKLARDMLPVYDSLQRALKSMSDEQKQKDKALIEGLELTMRELLNVFKKHGIEALAPKAGDTFDPQLHQALMHVVSPAYGLRECGPEQPSDFKLSQSQGNASRMWAVAAQCCAQRCQALCSQSNYAHVTCCASRLQRPNNAALRRAGADGPPVQASRFGARLEASRGLQASLCNCADLWAQRLQAGLFEAEGPCRSWPRSLAYMCETRDYSERSA